MNAHYSVHSQGGMMKSFLEYVDEAQAKLGMSDAVLSKHLGGEKNRSLVSSWRNDGKNPEDYYCIVIAEILEIDPLEIIASANYARAKDETKKTWWENFRKQHVKTMVGVLLGVAVLFSGLNATMGVSQAAATAVVFAFLVVRIMYIMSSWKRVRDALRRWRNKCPFDLSTA